MLSMIRAWSPPHGSDYKARAIVGGARCDSVVVKLVAALFLIAGGAATVRQGIRVLKVARTLGGSDPLERVLWRTMMMKHDPAIVQQARRTIEGDLRRNDPAVADEILKGIDKYQEMAAGDDAFRGVRRLALMVTFGGVLGPGLVCLGAFGVVGGAFWLLL